MTVFITGGTGYIGSRLIKALLKNGKYRVKALVRQGSERKLPPGCEIVYGNALDAATYINAVQNIDVFVHLIGVAHPSPSKKEAFTTIDLKSVQEAATVIKAKQVPHVVYISVSQYPTEIMHDYQVARAEGERVLLATGATCSFVRPWYVLGPGHWWPILLKPFYTIAKLMPSKREAAEKLDTVTIGQMIQTLEYAIGHLPEAGCTIYEVKGIRSRKYEV